MIQVFGRALLKRLAKRKSADKGHGATHVGKQLLRLRTTGVQNLLATGIRGRMFTGRPRLMKRAVKQGWGKGRLPRVLAKVRQRRAVMGHPV